MGSTFWELEAFEVGEMTVSNLSILNPSHCVINQMKQLSLYSTIKKSSTYHLFDYASLRFIFESSLGYAISVDEF